MHAGEDNSNGKVLALARRFAGLIQPFSGGDAAIEYFLGKD